jgi:hypothetical protein
LWGVFKNMGERRWGQKFNDEMMGGGRKINKERIQ